jgi:hypothetical protein
MVDHSFLEKQDKETSWCRSCLGAMGACIIHSHSLALTQDGKKISEELIVISCTRASIAKRLQKYSPNISCFSSRELQYSSTNWSSLLASKRFVLLQRCTEPCSSFCQTHMLEAASSG